MRGENFDFKPRYFQILSENDCMEYNLLREKFTNHASQTARGHSSNYFSLLNLIKKFCVREDGNDWKRNLVCGICWLNERIGINYSQFSFLVDEKKSSINKLFQKIGYTICKNRSELIPLLIEKIPFLKDNRELKEWTIMNFEAATPIPKLPPFKVSTFFTFSTPNAPTNQFFSPPQSPIDSLVIPNIERPLSRPNGENFFDDPFCLPPEFLLNDDNNNS